MSWSRPGRLGRSLSPQGDSGGPQPPSPAQHRFRELYLPIKLTSAFVTHCIQAKYVYDSTMASGDFYPGGIPIYSDATQLIARQRERELERGTYTPPKTFVEYVIDFVVLLVLFVVVMAGIGVYGLINGSAADPAASLPAPEVIDLPPVQPPPSNFRWQDFCDACDRSGRPVDRAPRATITDNGGN
jgi:hypothetical protein